jgi:hypothetical protein
LTAQGIKLFATRRFAGNIDKIVKKSEIFDTKILISPWVEFLFILSSFRGEVPFDGNYFPFFKIKEYWINFKAIPLTEVL